jgi:hypothetical protein
MQVFLFYGEDTAEPALAPFRTYAVAGPDEAHARRCLPAGFHVHSCEVATTLVSPVPRAMPLFWFGGRFQPLDW